MNPMFHPAGQAAASRDVTDLARKLENQVGTRGGCLAVLQALGLSAPQWNALDRRQKDQWITLFVVIAYRTSLDMARRVVQVTSLRRRNLRVLDDAVLNINDAVRFPVRAVGGRYGAAGEAAATSSTAVTATPVPAPPQPEDPSTDARATRMKLATAASYLTSGLFVLAAVYSAVRGRGEVAARRAGWAMAFTGLAATFQLRQGQRVASFRAAQVEADLNALHDYVRQLPPPPPTVVGPNGETVAVVS